AGKEQAPSVEDHPPAQAAQVAAPLVEDQLNGLQIEDRPPVEDRNGQSSLNPNENEEVDGRTQSKNAPVFNGSGNDTVPSVHQNDASTSGMGQSGSVLGKNGRTAGDNPMELDDEEELDPGQNLTAADRARMADLHSQRLLAGARADQEAAMEKDQLMAEFARVSAQLDDTLNVYEKCDRERIQSNNELALLKRKQLEKDTKASRAEAARTAARKATSAGFQGLDVEDIRKWRATRSEDDCRTRVKLGSILHPDGICKTCRPMKIGDTKLVEDPMLAPWKDKKFSSLRELAAFIDRKEQSKKLDSWELSKAIDESCLEKDVTTFSLKMAYRKGMCPCACDLARQVAMFGVEFEEEETRISDAISEVLARSGKRSSRKKMVVLIPDDSVITTCGGSFREAEGMKYADETEMRKILSDMKGKNLPESLVVLLKKSLGDSMLKLVKKNLLVLAKEEDISIYVTTDLLPKKSDLYTQESINALQEWLVLWNSEKKQKNIMIMSPVSGLLEKTYALAMLFPVARKESKWLFEQAVRYIVYGEVLPPLIAETLVVDQSEPRRKISTHHGQERHVGNPVQTARSLATTLARARIRRSRGMTIEDNRL
ncbi:hypothetical protein PMAYCL1PPCAC_20168, partial [Pristionchus mayeri]